MEWDFLCVSAGSLQGPVHDVSLRAGAYTQMTHPCNLGQARQPWVSRDLAKCVVLRKQERRPLQVRKKEAEESIWVG